ncbi:UNVERIFIED_CONTAM: hypothetical protein Slati_1475100 [Sesamum latifolium]|uniref:Uncharacterized protein n=1 Tax=Sesamum latifolium TaxID=2727402 RepID=A0AAW2X4R0_9LAMI
MEDEAQQIPKGASTANLLVDNQNTNIKAKQSDNMPSLETIQSSGEKSVQGNPSSIRN